MFWSGVTLFPTFICNFSCPFCAFSADLNQHQGELSLGELEKISRGIGRVLTLHIGGGEPFIRQDLPEVIAAFRRNAGVRRVDIPTNGWSADRIGRAVRRILELSPGLRLNVRVSIDGVGELHDRVRKHPGSYRAAGETLEALRELSSSFPGLSTGVCQTVTSHNQHATLSTYRTIRDELRPDSMVVNVCRDGSMEDRGSLDVVPERYSELAREMNSDVARGRSWNYPRDRWYVSAFLNGLHATVWDLISRELTQKRPPIRCAAGARKTLVIYSNGDAAFCELHPLIGNLKEHGCSVASLLKTDKARDSLQSLQNCGKRHEICWHIAAPDPFLNPAPAARILLRSARLAVRRAWDAVRTR